MMLATPLSIKDSDRRLAGELGWRSGCSRPAPQGGENRGEVCAKEYNENLLRKEIP